MTEVVAVVTSAGAAAVTEAAELWAGAGTGVVAVAEAEAVAAAASAAVRGVSAVV